MLGCSWAAQKCMASLSEPNICCTSASKPSIRATTNQVGQPATFLLSSSTKEMTRKQNIKSSMSALLGGLVTFDMWLWWKPTEIVMWKWNKSGILQNICCWILKKWDTEKSRISKLYFVYGTWENVRPKHFSKTWNFQNVTLNENFQYFLDFTNWTNWKAARKKLVDHK